MTPTSRGLDRTAWRLVARRSWHGFVRHRGIDSAAALTFFAALALLPAALSVVSAVAVSDTREGAVRELLVTVDTLVRDSTVTAVAGPLQQLTELPSPGWGLAIGLVLTLWTASGYATAFGRAVNTVYEVQEGRQFWKFRGHMLLVTLVTTVAFAGILTILLGTPAVAQAIGENVGIGEPWLTMWNIGKWLVLLVLALVIVAILYFFTPNVLRPRLRWVSWGSAFAIVLWATATAGFAVYVASIGQYDEIYGWLGGGVVLLLWLYLTNLVLVLGAEVDAEIVRVRQLQAGIEAEDVIRLPLRDSTRNLMIARQSADDAADGRALREQHVP
ncbi:MAG: Membrane protein [Microbacteriaceae bacterium]|jgi:membrane protein|nr:Membrane protein [Microbacteriaceae bacterium]HEV7956928.1 YihY/virulence factor BrkB family protein [Marisediminicola sp.]